MATGFAAGGLMMARDDIKWYMDRRAQKKSSQKSMATSKKSIKKSNSMASKRCRKSRDSPVGGARYIACRCRR